MWSQCRKAPLLLFILLQWVEVLSDTWGAWHTHSLYKESLIPSSQTHTCTCEHTHTQDLLSRLGWIPGCVGHARSSVNAEAQPAWWKVQKGEQNGSRLDCLHPLSFLLHPTHPPARAIFIFSSWLTHLPSLSAALWISCFPKQRCILIVKLFIIAGMIKVILFLGYTMTHAFTV